MNVLLKILQIQRNVLPLRFVKKNVRAESDEHAYPLLQPALCDEQTCRQPVQPCLRLLLLSGEESALQKWVP